MPKKRTKAGLRGGKAAVMGASALTRTALRPALNVMKQEAKGADWELTTPGGTRVTKKAGSPMRIDRLTQAKSRTKKKK
jgi:hypothetical protein